MDFDSCVKFCLKYSWIFDCKMTDVFVTQPWLQAPPHWISVLSSMSYSELEELSKGNLNEQWPSSLQEFCQLCQKFQMNDIPKYTGTNVKLSAHACIGMSAKKRHEIGCLAPLINDICEGNASKLVVDVGCGLGYLGQVLTDSYQINVIGLELKESNCQGQRKAQNSHHGENRAHQMLFDTSEECRKKVRNLIYSVQNASNEQNVCLVGLHCCGDLTPAMLHQFCEMSELGSLVCMGCCYHRLSKESEHIKQFTYFPLSSKLRSVFDDNNTAYETFNGYSLRQACQETISRWIAKTDEAREDHKHSVAFRAVFQYCMVNKDYEHLMKRRKKLVGSNSFCNFDVYVGSLVERLNGLDETEVEKFRRDMLICYSECEPMFTIIRWYTVLQHMIQRVLEGVILSDRLMFLKERGLKANLLSVFDDFISPRNIALIGKKQ